MKPLHELFHDCRAELDEKVFLIGLFVVIAVIGLVSYANAVSDLLTLTPK